MSTNEDHQSARSIDAQARQWPTPAASVTNDGESVESWDARREQLRLTSDAGNGAGEVLTIEAKRWVTPQSADAVGSSSTSAAAHGGRSLREDVKGRRLSPRFVEWLMNWPDNHTAAVPRVDRLRILGNGVVPAQAELALRMLLDTDQ